MNVLSINISKVKGRKKTPVDTAMLVKGKGIEGDAHAGSIRQISLLSKESIQKMGAKFNPGDFAENITTAGIDILPLGIGDVLKIGEVAVIRIVQKGKECHDRCEIYKMHGQCVMPQDGIFAEVIVGGMIRKGDAINCLPSSLGPQFRQK